MMVYGLGTHFNELIPIADLGDVYGFGFRWSRQDAQLCDVETLRAMIADAETVGLKTLTIVYDLERLQAVPFGRWAEWGNELDFTLNPREYRSTLNDAAEMARQLGIPLCAPCISNLDRDSLRWMEQVRGNGWPRGMSAVSVHRYGNGTFDHAHKGFR